MQKTGTVLTAASVALGVIVAFLRIIHTNKYMTDGLPAESLLTSVLNFAAIFTIIIAFIIAYVIGKKKASHKEVLKSMATDRGGIFLVFQILAALLIAVHGFVAEPCQVRFIKNQDTLATVLACICAAAHIIVSILIYTGKTKKITGFLGIAASLYFCLRLGETFYVNMANPVLLEYSYECMAIGVCALYLTANAANAAGRDQVFNIVITSVLALFCAPAALTGPQLAGSDLLLYIAVIIMILPVLSVYMPNLIKREKVKKEKKAKA